MFKKLKALILCMILCIGMLIPFDSKAYGEDSNADFYVKYSEPTTNEYSGYISVAYLVNGTYRLYTYFWVFSPNGTGTYDIEQSHHMTVNVTPTSIHFAPRIVSNGGYDVTLMCYDWHDNIKAIIPRTFIPEGTHEYQIHQDDYSGTPIQGYMCGGNIIFSSGLGMTSGIVPTIHWNESVDATQLDGQLYQIISRLSNIDGDVSNIGLQLEAIWNQNNTTNLKLEALERLANQIKAEQEESNTWLEKIFNWLKDSPEQEKQEAQTQGGNSVAEGTNAIEDKGQGFSDSMTGLINSMSYNGTECSWTFPTVKLPAIAGVMEERVLIENQDIDFGFWIDSIPSNIMLLIQSVLTMALIVYCFKELYDTISYVLTLRGSNNE